MKLGYEQQSKSVAVTLVNKELNEDGVLFIFSVDKLASFQFILKTRNNEKFITSIHINIDDTLFPLHHPQLYSIDNKQTHCFEPMGVDEHNISNTAEQIEQCGVESISIKSLMTRIEEFLKYEFFENYAKSGEGEKWIF
jgi:hypothetical protein